MAAERSAVQRIATKLTHTSQVTNRLMECVSQVCEATELLQHT